MAAIASIICFLLIGSLDDLDQRNRLADVYQPFHDDLPARFRRLTELCLLVLGKTLEDDRVPVGIDRLLGIARLADGLSGVLAALAFLSADGVDRNMKVTRNVAHRDLTRRTDVWHHLCIPRGHYGVRLFFGRYSTESIIFTSLRPHTGEFLWLFRSDF